MKIESIYFCFFLLVFLEAVFPQKAKKEEKKNPRKVKSFPRNSDGFVITRFLTGKHTFFPSGPRTPV